MGEEQALLVAAGRCRSPFVRPMIELAVETGLRRGELLGLEWHQVDLGGRSVLILDSKNGHPRHVVLTHCAVSVLASLPRTEIRVFSQSASAFRLAWERVRRRAGVNLHFHDLRHEALSERGCIASCRRIAAEGYPCGEREEVLRRPAASTRHWRCGLFLKQNKYCPRPSRNRGPPGRPLDGKPAVRPRRVHRPARLVGRDFEATSPAGIDLIAEASLRGMITARLMRAAKRGETNRAALKALALNGL